MLFKRHLPFLLILFNLVLCKPAPDNMAPQPTAPSNKPSRQLLSYVNPFIGTAGKGHTFPGASVPFGMVQLSPDTEYGKWDYCSGYQYYDSTLVGFSHTHLSGTGACDLGDILFVPWSQHNPYNHNNPKKPYVLYKMPNTEQASAGYYAVELLHQNVKVELTATERCGLHRYTFKNNQAPRLTIDLSTQIFSNWGNNQWGRFQWVNDSTLTGYKQSTGWVHDQQLYFAIQFNQVPTTWDFFNAKVHRNKQSTVFFSQHPRIELHFNRQNLTAKVALSPVSENGALQNLKTETRGLAFDQALQQAKQKWTRELSKIQIQTDIDSIKTIFYTAVYHSYLAPTLYADRNGDYRGVDKQVYNNKKQTHYSTFSLWDTFRSVHPLFTLSQTERVPAMMQSLLSHYSHNPRHELPMWSLQAYETHCMSGYHAVPVLTDAYLKKLIHVPDTLLLAACIASANANREGIVQYAQNGYVTPSDADESVSRTLEYAFDDYCIYQLANHMGNTQIAKEYLKRSQNWKNLFDTQSGGFFRAKDTNALFYANFDPLVDASRNDYTEGNAWQYRFFVPHNPDELAHQLGGVKRLLRLVDSLFALPQPQHHENNGHDVTGHIGQYAHGNEPVHHIPFLPAYFGNTPQTQKLVNNILQTKYSAQPDGLCGNDDCGALSAWYIWANIGMYPLNPVSGRFVLIGLPQNVKSVNIMRHNKSKPLHIGRATKKGVWVNNKLWNQTTIDYQTLVTADTILFNL